MRLGLAVFAFGWLGACSAQSEPAEIVREVTNLAEACRSGNAQSFGESIFPRLSSSSVALLEECAVSANGRVGREIFRPQDCLGLDRFLGQRGDLEVQTLSDDAHRATVRVVSGDFARAVEMVYEDGWKVDLQASLAANRSP